MTKDELFELYLKEREYQKQIFGEIGDNPSLNLASLLLFIERYVNKSKSSYADKWTADTPRWMISCKELDQGTAPVTTFEELIKVFALVGAALESFVLADPSYWRIDGVKKKWINHVEHDSHKCDICKLVGDWSVTANTQEWFNQHHKAGFELYNVDGRIFEKEKISKE